MRVEIEEARMFLDVIADNRCQEADCWCCRFVATVAPLLAQLADSLERSDRIIADIDKKGAEDSRRP